MANRIKWTAKKKEEFLLLLADMGNISAVCAQLGLSRSAAYEQKVDDSQFATAWDAAIEQYIEKLEAEADRRAVAGVEKPIYQGGKLVGFTQEYSDTLLIFRLKALAPERYRDRSEVKTTSDPIDWEQVPDEVRDAFINGKVSLDDVRRIIAKRTY